MHSSIAFVLLAGAAVVSAQNMNGTVSYYPAFNASAISDSDRLAWCNDQTASCPLLCLDQNAGAPATDDANTCDSDTCEWTCLCANGKTPSTKNYSLTMDFHECQQAVTDCGNLCNGDNQCVFNCGANKKCGATDPKKHSGSHGSKTTGVAGDGYTDATATASSTSTGSINLKGGKSSGNSVNAFGSYYSVGVVVVSFGLSIFAFVQ